MVLSAHNDSDVVVSALREGAHDFVRKSGFSHVEFVARIDAALRRHAAVRTSCAWEDLAIDLVACRATMRGEPINLTSTQLRLLIALVLRAPYRVSSPDLVARGWAGMDPSRGAFDNQIVALRRALSRAGMGLTGSFATGYALQRAAQDRGPVA